MTKNKLLMYYRDEINKETIHGILSIAEYKIVSSGDQIKLQRKVFNVMVECLQNICNHAEVGEEIKTGRSSVLVIGKEDETFFVITGNLISNKNVEIFKSHIDTVNQLDKEGLKELYKKTITENEYSEKGGAGLGIIDISRKSGNKLHYDFQKVDDKYSYITIMINISTTDNKE